MKSIALTLAVLVATMNLVLAAQEAAQTPPQKEVTISDTKSITVDPVEGEEKDAEGTTAQ